MQRYIVTFFILIVMTVNQMRTTGRKRKEKETHDSEDQRNQDVVFISFLNKEDFKNHSPKDEGSPYNNLENFGNIEVEGNKVTVVVPIEEIKRQKRKGCKNNCKKHSKAEMHSNHTRKENIASTLSLLKPHGNPVVIMKADKFRRDWCRTEKVKHRISEQGCRSKIITNNFCYGQCNSFFIPRQIRGRKDLNNFRSCSFCQPSSSRWMSVILHCPELVPPYRKKRIYRVDKCRCSTKNVT